MTFSQSYSVTATCIRSMQNKPVDLEHISFSRVEKTRSHDDQRLNNTLKNKSGRNNQQVAAKTKKKNVRSTVNQTKLCRIIAGLCSNDKTSQLRLD